MDWTRVRNAEVLRAYVNIFDTIEPKRGHKIFLNCFYNNMDDLVEWGTKKKPDMDWKTDPLTNIESEDEIIDAMWSIRSIWDNFIERIVEPVNRELPGLVPINWDDYD